MVSCHLAKPACAISSGVATAPVRMSITSPLSRSLIKNAANAAASASTFAAGVGAGAVAGAASIVLACGAAVCGAFSLGEFSGLCIEKTSGPFAGAEDEDAALGYALDG